MRTETEQTIYLKDYAPTPYRVDKVDRLLQLPSRTLRLLARLRQYAPNRFACIALECRDVYGWISAGTAPSATISAAAREIG